MTKAVHQSYRSSFGSPSAGRSSARSSSKGSKPRVKEAFDIGFDRPKAHSHVSHAKSNPKIPPSGTNATTHQALSTRSRIVDDICGSQCACVLTPTYTISPASD